jgi:hypothetical protein
MKLEVSMLQSLKDYPLLYAILLAAVLVCAFAWAGATRATKRRESKKQALIAQLEHEKQLRNEFKTVTQQQLIDTPAERLIEGLCCNIQMEQERAEDLRAAYDALPEPKRLIYALGYVIQDSRDGLSTFFSRNGQPLTGAALEAVQKLVGGDYCAIFEHEYNAFDAENEVVSFIKTDIEEQDNQFLALMREHNETIYCQAKAFILSYSSIFAIS